MSRDKHIATIRMKYNGLKKLLNERTRRVWAASEAKALGRGGIAILSEAIHMDRNTIVAGLREVEDAAQGAPHNRVRRSGGGRKTLVHDPCAAIFVPHHLNGCCA